MKYLRRLALKWIDDFGAMPEAEKVAFVLFCSVLGGIAGVVYYAAAHGAPGIVAQEESCAARSHGWGFHRETNCRCFACSQTLAQSHDLSQCPE